MNEPTVTHGKLSTEATVVGSSSSGDHVLDSNDDSDSDSTCEEFDFITSKWENGVETGLQLDWPGSHRSITINTKLSEDRIAPLFHGTQWAGTRVWKASVVALEYLLEAFPSGGSLLELGCGLGVPGMVWHLLHEPNKRYANELDGDDRDGNRNTPQRVVLTDMPDLLPQLKENVEGNFSRFYGRSIEAKDLDWSTEALQQLLHDETERLPNAGKNDGKTVFDICLNCDCIYEPLYGRDAWEALADVLAEVARQSPSTVLVSSVERRTADGLEDFIQRLEATGVVEPMRRTLKDDSDPHHIIEIYVTQGKRIADL